MHAMLPGGQPLVAAAGRKQAGESWARQLPRGLLRRGLADGRFRITGELGSGNFGKVLEAVDTLSGERVAVKLASSAQPIHVFCLEEEKVAMRALSDSGATPRMIWEGQAGNHEALVMELVGPTLESVVDEAGGTLKPPQVARLAEELVSVLERMHDRGLVHGDIKPDNFCAGRGDSAEQLFAIDFGLARWYRNRDTQEPLPYMQNRPFAGNAKYASVAAHLGVVLSRRDDLESLGYLLIQWIVGRLPWSGSPDRWAVRKLKLLTSLEELCKGCPPELLEYMRYCQGLNFEDKPDYAKLRALFRGLAASLGEEARPFWASEAEDEVQPARQSLDNLEIAIKGSPVRSMRKEPAPRRRKRDILRRWLGLL